MVKKTFVLDEGTERHLRDAAARLAKPQSEIVRLAIRDYSDRIGRLSERERLHLLELFDDLVPRIPRRPVEAVERELKARMIHLDTSLLVDALTGPRRSSGALRGALDRGERILISALVLYEWVRGPRRKEELAAQEGLFPSAAAVGFGPVEAVIAARLYESLARPRGREIDLAIAACALAHDAALWTLNPRDFRDVPGLRLYAVSDPR
jgi:predicted nucleic acid-binding protein